MGNCFSLKEDEPKIINDGIYVDPIMDKKEFNAIPSSSGAQTDSSWIGNFPVSSSKIKAREIGEQQQQLCKQACLLLPEESQEVSGETQSQQRNAKESNIDIEASGAIAKPPLITVENSKTLNADFQVDFSFLEKGAAMANVFGKKRPKVRSCFPNDKKKNINLTPEEIPQKDFLNPFYHNEGRRLPCYRPVTEGRDSSLDDERCVLCSTPM